ncbi:unnamed protein product [Withania somnifera]
MSKDTSLFTKLITCSLFSLPNSTPFAKILDSCINSNSQHVIPTLHCRILKTHFRSEVLINNKLRDSYGKSSMLKYAQKVFDKMPETNTYTWNSMINAYTPSRLIFEAEGLFYLMPEPDQCSWNLMVSSFAQCELFDSSVEYFVRMHKEDFILNEYASGSGLSACAGLRDLRMGVQIHGSVAKSRYSRSVYIGSELIDMYGKTGDVDSARKVFNWMCERNVVSWNSLISCYEQNGPVKEALMMFVRMMEFGFKPDEKTLANIVSACASLDDLIICNALVEMYAKFGRIDEARWIFDKIPIRSVVSHTSLVSGYARVASVKTARSVFMWMIERNVVSWNSLTTRYTQNGNNGEVLNLFIMLKRGSVWPTHYTFGNLLNACANLVDLNLGRKAHAHILKHGFRFQNGSEPDVFFVFAKLLDRDWVSWNAVMVGYAQNRHAMEALETFKVMSLSGEKPDHVTMIGVLCTCRIWQDVKIVRKLMRQRGVVKQPGCGWIEIQSQVHVFMVKARRHARKKRYIRY